LTRTELMIATLVDPVRRDVQHVTRSPLVERAAKC
jgi:hypothetical protein